MSLIEITPHIIIHESEITFDYIRASGPGGQNVNKVATAVQLRFQVAGSPHLPEEVKQRLLKLAGKRINSVGEMVIEAARFRTQEQNKQDALDRLVRWIQRAADLPRQRKRTRPSGESRRRRLEEKRQRGETKRLRRKNSIFEP